MKKLFALLIAAMMVVFLFSCKVNEEAQIKKVAKDYLIYLNSENYEEAMKLSTKETGEILEVLKSFASMDETPPKQASEIHIEILSCTIHNDSASCQYLNEGKEQQISLVKIKSKWLVDMSKESGPSDPLQLARADSIAAAEAAVQDSIAAVEYAQQQVEDTITYFDFCIADLVDQNGSALITLKINNRTTYNIKHLWLSVYFSDKSGKFIVKKDVMFDNISKYYIPDGDSVSYGNWQSVQFTLDKVIAENIGELYLNLIRVEAKTDTDENAFYEEDIYWLLKDYTNFKNSTGKDIKITF